MMLGGALVVVLVSPVSARGGLGKSTYAVNDAMSVMTWMSTYVPSINLTGFPVNSAKQCIHWSKMCVDNGHTTSCDSPAGNFQIHAVQAYDRESGSMSMASIEGIYDSALGNMSTFDPYMNNNNGFYTSNLDRYVSVFNAANVPYFASTFFEPSESKTYTSILVRAGTSPITFEIMGTSSLLGAGAGLYRHRVSRASPGRLARAKTVLDAAPRKLGTNGMPVLEFLHKSFASSNVARDTNYWLTALSGQSVANISSGSAETFAAKLLSSDEAEVLFVQSDQKTKATMSVADFEDYQVALHMECIASETQGFDRLADSHIGHSMPGTDLTPWIEGVEAWSSAHHGRTPYRYFAKGLFYLYMPNGWGVQLSGTIPDQPSGGGYDFCNVGTTGSCSK